MPVLPRHPPSQFFLDAIDENDSGIRVHPGRLGACMARKANMSSTAMTVAQAFELAVQHHQAGRLAEAEAIYRQILAADPRHADALHLLGVIAHQVGQHEIAVKMISEAISLDPNNPESHSNLGTALSARGRLDEAIAAYRVSIALRPEYVEAHFNLGNALKEKGQFDAAVAAYRRTLQFKPDYAEAHSNLGNALRDNGQLDEAIAAYRRALQLNQNLGEVCINLGNALMDRAQPDEAMECYERWDQRHAAPLRRFIRPHENKPHPGRRLKIGYVSPDFRHHVVCHFLTPLLEAHDHAEFEIYGYASVKKPDAITARMRKTADVWRDVLGMRDESLAELICEDGIDILVDLSQHTTDNRLLVFARKPAPVQVAWLGNPGSTGLRTMDYRLTDDSMEPEGSPWSESVEEAVRLPDSWFCYDPIDDYPPPGELPALRSGYVTFGCLNNFNKVNDAVLLRWAGVLSAVEGSQLLLRCPAGSAQARVRQLFESRGIGAERLELVAWTSTREEFLKLFERIDVALDPFPYTGGTTTCEALWMGIPVLTLPGQTVVSRQSMSILSAAGMPEFVAGSEQDYVSLAVNLARDLPRLAQLRATLRERMKSSPFMDAPRFARNVEQAYRQMWRTWCTKQSAPKTP